MTIPAVLARAASSWPALAGWGLALLIAFTPAWRFVELRIYDWLVALTAPALPVTRLVVVGIDEPSFAVMQRQWPWPRTTHARLVDSLRRAGAAVIAFDVVFAEPAAGDEDRHFAEAIRAAGNVVLASEEATDENVHLIQRSIVEPVATLADAAARTGIATVGIDADLIVRRLPDGPGTLWRAILDAAGGPPPRWLADVPLIRYGRPEPFDVVSYYQALEPATFLPPDFFRGRIVLVGLRVKPSPEPGTRPADLYASPLVASGAPLSSGVEIQAHVLASVMAGRVVREVPPGRLVVVVVGLAALTAWLFRTWRPLRSGVIALGLLAGLAGVAWGLFGYADLWLPPGGLLSGVILAYAAEGGRGFLREQALRRQLKQAFGHYVSPHLVEQIVADPNRLKLGGERREISVVFCDLAGFTTLAEQLTPEEVVDLLTRYLSRITRIVIDSGGTVVKYLGDGMMAMWGAPLPDCGHAQRACEAAVAMQEAVAALRAELVAAGRPPIHMRVGVHSGDAVVGNMGSDTRFDYTATGDTVNLASRLEGANKVYGTSILVSEGTTRLAAPSVGFRRIDRVRVKGKHEATELFTPDPDADRVRCFEEAIDAYRHQRWDEAEIAWHKMPGDPVARVYLARIAEYRRTPPPASWDGAFTLNEK